MLIEGGTIARAQMGDPSASVPTSEPLMIQPMVNKGLLKAAT